MARGDATAAGRGVGAPTGDLVRLIRTEAALEARVAEVREQAHRIVDGARDAASAAEARLEEEFAAARQRVQTEVERDRERRSREIIEKGKERAAAYERVPPPRITELASYVLRRLSQTRSP